MVACVGDNDISSMIIQCRITWSITRICRNSVLLLYVFMHNKPAHVAMQTASLNNNIFSNNMTDTSLFIGILHTDISDNFPIFHIDSSQTNTNCSNYFKQGKSEGFDSCDRPSNLAQLGSISNFLDHSDTETCLMTSKKRKRKKGNSSSPL